LLFGSLLLLQASCNRPSGALLVAADSVPYNLHAVIPEKPLVETSDTAAFYGRDTLSDKILQLLARNELLKLADWVHPELGICFSPYAYADSARMRCMTAKGLRYLAGIPDSVRRWGEQDGTGEPLRLSWNQYRRKFVWDKDYANLGTRRNAPAMSRGNSLLNAYSLFPGAAVVEWYVPGNERYAYMDWGSLYLVYLFRGGRWWLRAVVHDQWTI